MYKYAVVHVLLVNSVESKIVIFAVCRLLCTSCSLGFLMFSILLAVIKGK